VIREFIVGAPFGNYLTVPGVTSTVGTYTVRKRDGVMRWWLFWRLLRTLRPHFGLGWTNKLGLPNPGVQHVVTKGYRNPGWIKERIVSIHGLEGDDWWLLLDAVKSLEPAAIELNVSCPNVDTGCISIGTDAAETRALLERCTAETDRPLLAKLSPNVADIAPIATAAAEGGAHGLVLINTLRGIAIDRSTLQPLLGGGGGGLSGPAIKPVALYGIFQSRRATGLPIVGMGGVSSAQDCLEFLAAGANAVGVGTALFRDPALPATILADLTALLASRGVASVGDVVGMAHVGSAKPRLEVDARR